MRPASLTRRLIAGAGLWCFTALMVGGAVLAENFKAALERSLDARLTTVQESLLAIAHVGENDIVRLRRPLLDNRFQRVFSGWYWQIELADPSEGDGVPFRSRSLWDEKIDLPDAAHQKDAFKTFLRGPDDQKLRVLTKRLSLPGADRIYVMSVAADRQEILRQIADFNSMLLWSLGLLGVGLIGAVVIQIRVGLGPLHHVRDEVAAIRSGRASRLEGTFPAEIAPLADELNELLDHNREVLERARTHVGNLAHALKTPLTVLGTEAQASSDPLAKTVKHQTEVMRRQVEHYLARARTAASARVLGSRTPIAPVLADIVRTLERVNQDRGVMAHMDCDPGLTFRGERQDLEEMVGNLLDNGFKWARTGVYVTARLKGPRLHITVEDDGPGLSETERAHVVARGARLDESVPGSGLGLSIVEDIAKANRGSFALDKSDHGGLKAILDLPGARGEA